MGYRKNGTRLGWEKGHKTWNKGKKLSEEHKKNVSKAMKGKVSWRKGIKLSEKIKERMSKSRNGHRPYYWKGGQYKLRGYIYILKPNHPFATKKGYVKEHRFVIEQSLNRYLLPNETPHHINGIKDDNRPENLMAFINHGAHLRFERGCSIKSFDIIFDGRLF